MQTHTEQTRAEARAAAAAIEELDADMGDALIPVGRHAGARYTAVVNSDMAYCGWVRVNVIQGPLENFRRYIDRRWALGAPLRQLQLQDRQELQGAERDQRLAREREKEDMRQRKAQEREDLLRVRKSTARGEQLVWLSAISDLFDAFVLGRLPLADVLKLPRVCVALRDNTSSRGEQWMRVVAQAMARRAGRLVSAAKLAPHDLAAKRFFRLAPAWKLPSVRLFNGQLCGVDEHLRLWGVMGSEREAHAKIRNEVRLALQDWRKKVGAFDRQARKMGDLDKQYAKLVEATARAKNAISAASGFFARHTIELPFAIAAFDAAALPDWEKFATDARFACA